MAIAALGWILCCVAGACEIVLGDLPDGSPETATTVSTNSTGGGGGAGAESTSTTHTGGAAGAGGATASTSQSACCDCDQDGHDAIGMCGGDDCDDDDPTTHPGADYQIEPTAKGGFDHDCSQTVDPDPSYDKLITCGLIGLPCDAKQGFLHTIPACGQPGDWGTCQGNAIPCKDHVLDSTQRLPCK